MGPNQVLKMATLAPPQPESKHLGCPGNPVTMLSKICLGEQMDQVASEVDFTGSG